MKVFETLLSASCQWPDKTALIDAAGSLSYRELFQQAEALRDELIALGVTAGQGVGVRARNGRALVIGALAASACNAVVMPIHHQLKPDELSEMLARAPLCAMLDETVGLAAPALSGQTSPLRAFAGLRFTRLENQMLLAPGLPDAAFVRFTSGTTGAAKGVVLTHGDVLDRIHAANAGLGLGAKDNVLWVLPMAYHFYVSIILYLEVGATIIVSGDYLAESLLDAAWKHNATFLYITPMHARMLAHDKSGRGLPPSLQRVMSVSSRLDPQVARDFQAKYSVPVAQGFGIIEVGLPLMNIDEAAGHPESVGRPLPSFEAAILNDDLTPVSNGESGHLAFRGPGMFSGYLSPPRPRESVLRNGWFLTGDLAHRDSAGRIVLDGRCSSVIHVAGHKVFPEEVASVLDQHPAILRTRVSKRPHPQMGEVIHAEVQVRPGATQPAPEEMLAFCRRRLSNHKVPHSIEFVTEMNVTSSGKVRHG